MTSMIEHLSNDQIFLSKITEIILANLVNENFGINELAHGLGVSHHTLRRRLHIITNKTIAQFISETRLQKALEMLQNGKVTSSEVAYKVGFSSPAYFNKCFHEFFGYPPGQVKRTNTNNEKEIDSSQVKSKHQQSRSLRRTFIYISSGILLIAVTVSLIYRLFLKHSDPHAGNSIVKDVDGNIYHTVTIGTQVWLAEDLKTTRYNDGTAIPYVSGDVEWKNLRSAAFCWYDNDESNKTVYGALYNWYTINTGKLCPVGWHVASNSDWETLINYCSGWELAGGKLKEAGTAHWDAPNIGATNEFGFTAIPGGGRSPENGKFTPKGRDLGYWCPPRCGDFRSLCSDRAWIYFTEGSASGGCEVRCIKNN
jgi:uncharacterized protein (TIGR02145 family)